MALYLLIFSIIVITCVFLNKFSGKIGIPVLLFFLMLGLLCGSRYDEFASNTGWLVGDISQTNLEHTRVTRVCSRFLGDILSDISHEYALWGVLLGDTHNS